VTEHADWRDDAACLHADPDLFFPIASAGPALDEIDQAKRMCAACPVRKPCLAWALDQGAVYGVWGGTSEAERRVIRQADAAARYHHAPRSDLAGKTQLSEGEP
jgi:WhiB family transcriptional regulator, redox-sensing transcriptional regulator